MTGLCDRCGHDILDHFRRYACDCGCSMDPPCTDCGELASKHDDDAQCQR